MMVAWLLVKIFLIAHLSAYGSSERLPDFKTYDDNGSPRTCRTRNDDDPCPPDTQIEICEDKWEKVRCVPCAPGLRQCDWSTSEIPTQCYDPAERCSGDGDNLVKVFNLADGGCKIVCVCNEVNGYTGLDPNMCQYSGSPCPVDSSRQFSPDNQCLPCPTGYHNPRDDSVDKCISDLAQALVTTDASTTTSRGTTPVTQTTTVTDKTTTLSDNSRDKGNDEYLHGDKMKNLSGNTVSTSGIISQLHIWLPVSLGIVMIILGAPLCIWCIRRTRNKEERDHRGSQFCTCVFLHCCNYSQGNQQYGNISVNEPAPIVPQLDDDAQGPMRRPEMEDEEPINKPEAVSNLQEQPEPPQAATSDDTSVNPPDSDQVPGCRRPHEHDERSEGSLGHGRHSHGRGRPRTHGEQPGQNESHEHSSPQGDGGCMQGHRSIRRSHRQPEQFGSGGQTNSGSQGLQIHPVEFEHESGGCRREQVPGGAQKCDGQTEHRTPGHYTAYRSHGHGGSMGADQQGIKGLPVYSDRHNPPPYTQGYINTNDDYHTNGVASSISSDFKPFPGNATTLTSNNSRSTGDERQRTDPDSTRNKTNPAVSEGHDHSADSSTANTSGVPEAMPLNNSTEICDWTASTQRRQQTEVKRKLSDPITENTCAMENTFNPETATIHFSKTEKEECQSLLKKSNSDQ